MQRRSVDEQDPYINELEASDRAGRGVLRLSVSGKPESVEAFLESVKVKVVSIPVDEETVSHVEEMRATLDKPQQRQDGSDDASEEDADAAPDLLCELSFERDDGDDVTLQVLFAIDPPIPAGERHGYRITTTITPDFNVINPVNVTRVAPTFEMATAQGPKWSAAVRCGPVNAGSYDISGDLWVKV